MSDTLNSDPTPFDGPVFTTASARRAGTLIRFQVAGNVLTDDEEDVRYVEHVLAVHPAIDIVRFGQLFSRFIKAVNEANERRRAKAKAEGRDVDAEDAAVADGEATPDTTEAMENLDLINDHVEPSLDALRSCLTPKTRPLFDEVRPAIDANTLFEIIVMLTGELSPVDFSQRDDSSGGSPGTGAASTGGAPTEG